MAQSTPEIYRNPDGTFGKGTIANPKGHPKREIESEFLDVTMSSVSPEDWATVVQSMVSRAKAGDVQAAKWLGDYVLGKPTEHIAITQDESLKIALHLPQMERDDNGDSALPVNGNGAALPAQTGDQNVSATSENGENPASGDDKT